MGIGQAQEIGVTVSLNREANRKDRRSGATIEPDRTAVVADDAMDDGQAQSGPTFLRRVERVKNGGLRVFDAWSVVDHVDLDILGQPPHPHNDVSAFIDRLDGVSHEIDQHLFGSLDVEERNGRKWEWIHGQRYSTTLRLGLEQRLDRTGDRVDVVHDARQGLRSRHLEVVGDERTQAFELGAKDLGGLACGWREARTPRDGAFEN